MDKPFDELLKAFGIDSVNCKISTVGEGHIHDTFLVDRSGIGKPPLILQRINHHVFRNVEVLMKNLEIITSHIAYKNRNRGLDPACCGIILLEADEGNSWIGNEDTGFWRMFWFIENQTTYNIAPDPQIASEGGRAVAEFQSLLTDLDMNLIEDTIPRFHDLHLRTEQYREALTTGNKNRLGKSSDLIGFADKYMDKALRLYELSILKNIPLRLTHNDTKFNNILFHKDREKANCMIDLDTVMKGYSWFDVGDALRTCASPAAEDEPDIKKIDFRVEIFEGFIKGFLAGSQHFLTEPEKSLLHLAPAVFSYTQALRYLTDYLNDDIYYKTEFDGHNMQRARAQFALMQQMLKHEDRMAEITKKHSK